VVLFLVAVVPSPEAIGALSDSKWFSLGASGALSGSKWFCLQKEEVLFLVASDSVSRSKWCTFW
jgi:hypothetical protein